MIPINRKIIRNFLVLALFLLILADLIGPAVGITSTFSLDEPGSVGVWFESFLYILSAGLLALAAAAHFQQKNPIGWRWGLFSLFILYLSTNTNTRLNNKIFFTLYRPFSGSLWYVTLRVLFIFPLIALIVVLWPALRDIPARYRHMLIRAGVVFGIGAVLVDPIGDYFYSCSNHWVYLLEEVLEYSGFVLFIDSMLSYLSAEFGEITLNLRGDASQTIEGS